MDRRRVILVENASTRKVLDILRPIRSLQVAADDFRRRYQTHHAPRRLAVIYGALGKGRYIWP